MFVLMPRLLALCVAGVCAAGVLAAPPGQSVASTIAPQVEAARGGACVEDPAVMRRMHMEYLKHQRDETVHGGVRGAKYSLKTCIDCHASKVNNSVSAGAGNFCISCHTYAAVKIDCFECHAGHPAKPTALNASSTSGRLTSNFSRFSSSAVLGHLQLLDQWSAKP